ncbi:MAG: secondary thiamine-phosphate synthase enzyme YjbQ [Candidatus Micrarchaeota archaeon]
MAEFVVSTRGKTEALDVTDGVQKIVSKTAEGADGVAFVFALHGTCGLVKNEFEPRICGDYLKLAGKLEREKWAHDEIDDNAAAHLASAVAGSEVAVPVERGRLVLGTWQRIILLEFDGPRKRRIVVSFIEST